MVVEDVGMDDDDEIWEGDDEDDEEAADADEVVVDGVGLYSTLASRWMVLINTLT